MSVPFFRSSISFTLSILICFFCCFSLALSVSATPVEEYDDAMENLSQETADSAKVRLPIKQKMKRTGNIVARFVKSFDDYDTTL